MEIRDLQLELYEMLNIFDSFCKDHDIVYSLYGGTLLGAIRHKGFIPWDDDIDVCMTRDQYEDFVKCWNETPIDGFFLQDSESDPEWNQVFSKIRKEKSTFIEYDYQKQYRHTGLSIDVFALDRVHSGLLKIIDWTQWVPYLLSVKQIFPSRQSWRYRKNRISSDMMKKYRLRLRKKLVARCKKNDLPLADMIGFNVLNRRYSNNLFEEYTVALFEGKPFPIMKNYENFLITAYGDYMSLPPENERTWKHHPLIFDCEHSYNEINKDE